MKKEKKTRTLRRKQPRFPTGILATTVSGTRHGSPSALVLRTTRFAWSSSSSSLPAPSFFLESPSSASRSASSKLIAKEEVEEREEGGQDKDEKKLKKYKNNKSIIWRREGIDSPDVVRLSLKHVPRTTFKDLGDTWWLNTSYGDVESRWIRF